MRSLLLVAVAACATPASLPPLPGAGGPPWTEVTSEHFTVWTDASLPAADKLVRQMEHMRQVVLGTAFPGVEVKQRTLVIAFRNAAEVHAFVPEQFDAMAFPPGMIEQPAIITEVAPDDPQALTHELAHVISFGAIPEQPHWFAEGLATFFESIDLNPGRATVDVGDVKPGRSRIPTIQHEGLMPMAEVVACKRYECMGARFYATVWAVYTYLANVHPDGLLRLEALLAALPADQQAGAWAQAFPDLPYGKLDHELPQWLRYGKHTTWHFKVDLAEVHITTRPLRDDDVRAARDFVHASLSRDPAVDRAARAELCRLANPAAVPRGGCPAR